MIHRFTDMMGREVAIPFPTKRIVSVVPSQTELLYDLGLDEEVVGITKFCVHPDSWFRSKRGIGGTKTLHIDQIKELHPDLIIANKEENTQQQIEELATMFPVWVSQIHNIAEGLEMIRQVGTITNTAGKAAQIITDVQNGFASLSKHNEIKRVAYMIWYKPWMSAGGDTFISDMIETMGWENVLKHKDRYPEVSLTELATLQPSIVLLSSEPFPFKDKHIAEVKAALPQSNVLLVDGEMFSWYGSRMVKATGYLQHLISAVGDTQ